MFRVEGICYICEEVKVKGLGLYNFGGYGRHICKYCLPEYLAFLKEEKLKKKKEALKNKKEDEEEDEEKGYFYQL